MTPTIKLISRDLFFFSEESTWSTTFFSSQDEQSKTTLCSSSEKCFFKTFSKSLKRFPLLGNLSMMVCFPDLDKGPGVIMSPLFRRFFSDLRSTRPGPHLQLWPSQKIRGLTNEQSVRCYKQKTMGLTPSPFGFFFLFSPVVSIRKPFFHDIPIQIIVDRYWVWRRICNGWRIRIRIRIRLQR